jgi:hypothetical protein
MYIVHRKTAPGTRTAKIVINLKSIQNFMPIWTGSPDISFGQFH